MGIVAQQAGLAYVIGSLYDSFLHMAVLVKEKVNVVAALRKGSEWLEDLGIVLYKTLY